jgi:hypothetical protein
VLAGGFLFPHKKPGANMMNLTELAVNAMAEWNHMDRTQRNTLIAYYSTRYVAYTLDCSVEPVDFTEWLFGVCGSQAFVMAVSELIASEFGE